LIYWGVFSLNGFQAKITRDPIRLHLAGQSLNRKSVALIVQFDPCSL